MLATALRCFQGASRCECDSDEEEWLIHYMLGKIAEKRRQAPGEYLQLYQKVPAPVVGGRHVCLPAQGYHAHGLFVWITRQLTTCMKKLPGTPEKSTTTTPQTWPWRPWR